MTKERILQFVAVAFNTVTNKEVCKRLVMDFLKEELPGGPPKLNFDQLKRVQHDLAGNIFPHLGYTLGKVVKVEDRIHPERSGKYALISLPPDADPGIAEKIREAVTALFPKKPNPQHGNGAGGHNGATGPQVDEIKHEYFDTARALEFIKMGNSVRRKSWQPGIKMSILNNGQIAMFITDGSLLNNYTLNEQDISAKDWQLTI